ncbi:MAG: hypothetical protein WC414_01320 [Patescibacteria group bacterium]
MEVIFVSSNGYFVDRFDKEKHRNIVRKFLLFQNPEEEILLVGGQDVHAELFCDYHRAMKNKILLDRNKIIGAGNCFNGFITNWSSSYFGVKTPEEKKEDIRKLLQMEEGKTG